LVVGAAIVAGTAYAMQDHIWATYVILPVLVWTALRFQLQGAAVSLALITITCASYAATLTGAFSGDPDLLHEKVIALQTFLGVSAVSTLLVAVLSQQYRDALSAIKDINVSLEQRISERTQQLAGSEHRFQLAIDAARALVYEEEAAPGSRGTTYGLSNIIGEVDNAAGLTRQMWFERIHPDDLNDHLAILKETLSDHGKNRFHSTYRIRHRDGNWRSVMESAQILRDRKNIPRSFVGAVVDVTERANAAESQSRLAAIVTSSQDAIISIDLNGNIESWNAGAERLLGYSRDEALGQSREMLVPDDRLQEFNTINEKLKQGEAISAFDTVRKRKDGSLVEVSVSVSPVKDAWQRVSGAAFVLRDITDRKKHEEQLQLLMREVNHRSKNVLALVQAIARQMHSTGSDNVMERLQQRLMALAASHDLLVHSNWTGVRLDRLVTSQLAHFKDLVGDRIQLLGPSLVINAQAAQALGMALHELATNAGKYGALSNLTGKVAVSWSLQSGQAGSAEADSFTMAWVESGGPRVKSKRKSGFGTRVVERISKLSLDAEVEFDLAPKGLKWRLTCDPHRVLEGATPPPAPASAPSKLTQPSSSRKRVLVVEDEALIALDLISALENAGYAVLGPATNVGQALDLLNQTACDAAVLDINLGSATSEPVAARLTSMGIPFVIMSGLTDHQRPASIRNAPFIGKPLDPKNLVSMLESLLAKPDPSMPPAH
jgi:PAS domain S-box-containing protein